MTNFLKNCKEKFAGSKIVCTFAIPSEQARGKPKIIDNTERDNEVKKKKRLSLISKFEFFRVAKRTAIS